MKPGRIPDSTITVHWCFWHARREWSDEACAPSVRWTLPNGQPMRVGDEAQRQAA